jgi:uncharacterized protein (DUF488 family)
VPSLTDRHADRILLALTIGHSTLGLETFIRTLRENAVNLLVDIRTVPRSRHNPQFDRETLPQALLDSRIEYRHMSGLGGLRKAAPGSPNMGWRNASFRGFADYMQTPGFEESLGTLIGLIERERLAMMCAEALPWRCHRSLIADAMLVRHIRVEHIMADGTHHHHTLTPWARVIETRITYPPAS